MPTPKTQSNPIKDLLSQLKIGYFSGQNPIARAHTGYGFLPAKNVALNLSRLINRVPVDPELMIQTKRNGVADPAVQARNMTSSIGRIERITNTYGKPRLKLAD